MTNEEAIKQQKFLIDAYKELQNIGDRAIKVGRIIKSCEMSIEALSEQRAKGKWIIVDDTEKFIAKCSICGRIEDSRMVKDYPFCHCGAKMKGGAV